MEACYRDLACLSMAAWTRPPAHRAPRTTRPQGCQPKPRRSASRCSRTRAKRPRARTRRRRSSWPRRRSQRRPSPAGSTARTGRPISSVLPGRSSGPSAGPSWRRDPRARRGGLPAARTCACRTADPRVLRRRGTDAGCIGGRSRARPGCQQQRQGHRAAALHGGQDRPPQVRTDLRRLLAAHPRHGRVAARTGPAEVTTVAVDTLSALRP